jgi:hypothetical protein
VIRSIVVALVLVTAPILVHAQEGSPGAERKWSVSTGIGFASSIGAFSTPSPFFFPFFRPAVISPSQSGFLWQLDGQYRVTPEISVGGFLQVAPFTGGTLFSIAADGRYHFGFLRSQSNEFLSKLTPYAGVGFGLGHVGSDFGDVSDNAALFSFIAGIEYDVTDQVALTSDMRFNVLAGELFGDSFYYSWQIVGARLRF